MGLLDWLWRTFKPVADPALRDVGANADGGRPYEVEPIVVEADRRFWGRVPVVNAYDDRVDAYEGDRARGIAASTHGGTVRATAGRVTVDDTQSVLTSLNVVAPIRKPINDWRKRSLDAQTLSRVDEWEVIELLADNDPTMSRGLYDFLRMCNPEVKITAYKKSAGTSSNDSKTPDNQAQAVLDEFEDRLKDNYGSASVVYNRLFTGAFMRGAFFAEVVLDRSGRVGVDLVTPDPKTVRFMQFEDPDRGKVWVPGQYQGSDFVRLDYPTIGYIPVDPFPGSPYGRSPATPAIFPTIFSLGLLHDLRRVVAQQGYPRLDIEIVLDEVKKSMPLADRENQAKLDAYVKAVIAAVERKYATLRPEEAYTHTSAVKLNRPVGTVDTSSLGGVKGLQEQLDLYSVRALKTMPLTLGITDGVSEANANRQWEIFVAGIKSMQMLCEALLERLLEQMLLAGGVVAEVCVEFAELRAAELLRDEQARQLNIQNTEAERDNGWIEQDEAAQKVVGHAAVAEEPLAITMQKEQFGQTTELAKQGLMMKANPGQQPGQPATGSKKGPQKSAKTPKPGKNDEAAKVDGASARELLSIVETFVDRFGDAYVEAAERTRATVDDDGKVTPSGADDELPAIPELVVVDDADVRAAVDLWKRSVKSDFVNLLGAEAAG